MGEINIPHQVRDALRLIDTSSFGDAIRECEVQEQSTALGEFKLYNCGEYVGAKLRYFNEALASYRGAKAAKKRAETLYDVQKYGRDLRYAVEQMQARIKQDEQDELLFQVDDHIMQPYRFSEQLSVCVNYQWRKDAGDKWSHGCITFTHRVDSRPDYAALQSKRKPSAAQEERAKQERLCEEWNHLMSQSLYSVRGYFKGGGDGSKIPESFQVKPDSYSGRVNNHSAKFWRVES